MLFDTKFEFILQFEKILGEMKTKNYDTYCRNIQFLSIESIETIRPVLLKFFPRSEKLINTLNRKDIDLMLMRILRSEVVGFQGEGERIVKKAKNIILQFGFLPPVAFFYVYNGAELFEAMLERTYRALKKHGKPILLSDLWRRFSAPLTASFELKSFFDKELMFKIRQRLKNYLEKDSRFFIDARSPKKLYVSLVEWNQALYGE